MAWRIALAAVLMITAITIAQVTRSNPADATTTAPASLDAAAIEFRAMTAFNQEQYQLALDLFNQVLPQVANQPEKLASLQERIRVCQANLAAQAKAIPQPAGKGTETPVNLSVEAATQAVALDSDGQPRTPHKAPTPGETRVMTIKELGNFEYDQDRGGNIPADVSSLNGMTIRLRGFMVPLDQADRITQFALVPSLFNCCFGKPPQLQHTITINCPEGKSVSYFPDEIVVTGTLTVKEEKDGDYIMSIFQISAGSIKPLGH